MIPDTFQVIDFLVQITGDKYNPTGIVTPLTDNAFQYFYDHDLELCAYDITDTNGFCYARRDVDDIIDTIRGNFAVSLYHPEYGAHPLQVEETH